MWQVYARLSMKQIFIFFSYCCDRVLFDWNAPRLNKRCELRLIIDGTSSLVLVTQAARQSLQKAELSVELQDDNSSKQDPSPYLQVHSLNWLDHLRSEDRAIQLWNEHHHPIDYQSHNTSEMQKCYCEGDSGGLPLTVFSEEWNCPFSKKNLLFILENYF